MNHKKVRIEAVVLTVLLLGAMFLVPASSVENDIEEKSLVETYRSINNKPYDKVVDPGPFILDRKYILDPEPAPLDRSNNDDVGTRKDAGDKLTRSTAIYPGELVDNTPGRGVTGELDSSDEDWFDFSVCIGQDIDITMTLPGTADFDLALWDETETMKVSSSNVGNGVAESVFFTAEYTGFYYMAITYAAGGSGQYSFDVDLSDQNDANTGDDAGNTFADAVLITPDTYSGYLDMDDPYDWYKFVVDPGDGIHFNLEMYDTTDLSDFDILLYNPSEELVHYEKYYYDDELLYPADVSGEWRAKIEIFPGWVDAPEPTEWKYYNYGSGAYNLEFAIDGSAPAPPGPIPQPQITPMTKTFIINNDPDSNNDEYGYIASIPACNYLEGSDRYLAPIVYDGDDTSTNYFDTEDYRGVVDDTTDYLLEDWNDYLTSHGDSATEYTVPADPIEAAAEIATNNWVSSDLAVVAVDGSDFEDEVKQVFQKTKTLKRTADVTEIYSDDPKLAGAFGYPMLIGPKWGALKVDVFDITASGGDSNAAQITQVFPQFMDQGGDWWPVPYDGAGDSFDLYYPLTQWGIWSASSQLTSTSWDTMRITKLAGHRYKINIGAADADSALKVTVSTDTESDLQVFLVDPQGHIRAPDIPQWTGPVLPIHEWYGYHNPPVNPWRAWEPEDHLDCSAEVLHPEQGKWTAIVVPRYEDEGSTKYTITAELRKINPKRADAAVSAANAAVIASQEHAPLLYVTEDSIPSETQSAFTALGVTKVIFVERGGIGSGVSGLPTLEADLTTMQEIIDYIKAYPSSENYITITSIKSGDGYFAPAAMLAAYHGSPVLRIGDAPGNPAGLADRIETWRLWKGDYYHGSRAPGHLPVHDEPIEEMSQLSLAIQLFKFFMGWEDEHPPIGLDAKRYWNEELHDSIHDWIAGYGLDLSGQDGYCFVAPRDDIYLPAHAVMMGNNSYAGHIPGLTPAYISAIIVRNILYPALIFANENRDVTTTMLMNYPDGGSWTTNDGVSHIAYSSRVLKKVFSTHGRTFDGHSLWDAHLERMNDGASVFYYSGHGTGGSGQSAQYIEGPPQGNYPSQIWWDSWRGYSYDSWKMPRKNGRVWYNPEPPMLYDIIHYDHVDGNYENLRSNAVFYMSCSTQDAFGPLVFLDHGAVLNYGNAGSGLCPQADLQDDWFFEDAMVYGTPVGPAFAKTVWLHFRDFTTGDPTSMYGSSSLYPITTVQCIYGDPNLILYSPEWTSPIPVD